MANLQQLASDDNNPDFMGSHNPDTKLWARFYVRPRMMRLQTEKEGHPIFKDELYIEIRTPGDDKTVVDRPAREGDKARFPLQWQHYMNTKGGDPANVGTPIEQWPRMTPAMVEMLKALKFYTVESIALASDAQINSVGMIAGMAPFALRETAKTYLSVAKDSAFAQKLSDERKADQEKMAAMEKEMAELRALVAQATAPQQKEKRA